MSGPRKVTDLTRWNRAGLQRFRYVGGNAVDHLDTIRAALAKSFKDWPVLDDSGPKTDNAIRQRKLGRYRAPRQDMGWEIARTFARATHILTEHMDAFANEGFISTATQWEYLKRLVDPLDYRPRPPASAQTPVALIAKGEPGMVAAGLQMQHVPNDGGLPLVFETLVDVDVDAALNGLRIKGWNRNPRRFDPFAKGEQSPWPLPEEHKVSAGQHAVLAQGGSAFATTIRNVEDGLVDFASVAAVVKGFGWICGDTALYVEPDKVWKPVLNGPDAIAVDDSKKLSEGQLVVWESNGQSGFARVSKIDRNMMSLSDMRPTGVVLPSGAKLRVAQEITAEQFDAHGGQWRFRKTAFNASTGSKLRMIGISGQGQLQISAFNPILVEGTIENGTVASYALLTNFSGDHLGVFDPTASDILATLVQPQAGAKLTIPGGPGKLRGGDLVVAEDSKRVTEALRIATITTAEDTFDVSFVDPPKLLTDIALLHGPFKTTLRPTGHDRNPTHVTSATFVMEGAGALPAIMTTGKALLVEPDTKDSKLAPFQATLKDVQREVREITLSFDGDGFKGYTIADMIIRGNVVMVGHGETMPSTILGSGEASQNNQTFLLEKNNLSHVADGTLEAGVRAALKITVDGRSYTEVSALRDSENGDAHFETRITENGHLRIIFGDGFHGRRLPTGANNVMVQYRVGTGAGGNSVPALAFTKTVRPHVRVDRLRQPLDSWGGQDMEDVEGIRRNAPAYLAAQGRGVSLSDFEYLARTQPGIWNARAFRQIEGSGRQELIEVVLVPASDAPLGTLGKLVETKLQALAPPGIKFRALRFDPVPLVLSITIRVNAREFDPEQVEADVRAAVFTAFNLSQRSPGQSLMRSEVYAIVERTRGIATSDALLFGNAVEPLLSETGSPLRASQRGPGNQIWVLRPTERQVVYLREPAAIQITREEAFT